MIKSVTLYINKVLLIILLSLASVSINFAYSHSITPEQTDSVSSFNNIIALLKSYELRNEDHKTQAQFISEINRIHLQVNPEVDANLNYVWILSGRYTYKHTNSGSAAQNANGVDVNDGYNRIRLGIKIARKATAKS